MKWVICRHTKGGWHVWELERVLKMNVQRLMRGAPMDDEWRVLELAESEHAANERMAELKRQVRDRRKAMAVLGQGAVPYPVEEEARDVAGVWGSV